MHDRLSNVLKQYWGYTSFRPGQEAVITDIVNQKNVMALFPTGAGKSICYQLPAMLSPGITLVISPLVSLMKDQVDALKAKDIQAITIHSGLAYSEMKLIMDNALQGRYKLIYISPERLVSENFREYLPNLNISLLIVDEAHCISQWGHDFRPSYLRIKEALPLLHNVTVAAFTASAPPKVQEDIIANLFATKPVVHQSDFSRNNLNFYVVKTENKSGYILKLLQRFKGNTLIFCDTRRETEETARFLTASGFQTDFYHAGLPRDLRSSRQELWMKGKITVMACTNAFGMGVDKENVRLVVHTAPPQTPEAYYQEAGRAGRDGNKSWCILMYREHETEMMHEKIIQSYPSPKDLEIAYNAVFNYFGYAAGAGAGIVAPFDLAAIAARYKLKQLQLLHAVSNIEALGYWTISESLFSPSRVQIKWPYEEVYNFKLKNENLEPVLDVLLRSYGGVFESFVKISENTLAKRLKITIEELIKQLKVLHQLGTIEYFQQSDKPMITFLESRSPYPGFNIKKLEPLRNSKLQSLKNMEMYMTASRCRSSFWLEYFTQQRSGMCGHCDYCMKEKRKLFGSEAFNKQQIAIKNILGNTGKSRTEILEKTGSDFVARETLRWLMDHKKVLVDSNQKLYWNE